MTPSTPAGTGRMKLPRLYPPLWFLLFAVAAIGFSELLPLAVEVGRVAEILALLSAIAGGVLALWV